MSGFSGIFLKTQRKTLENSIFPDVLDGFYPKIEELNLTNFKVALYDNLNEVKSSELVLRNTELYGVSGAIVKGKFDYTDSIQKFRGCINDIVGSFSYVSYNIDEDILILAADRVGSKQIFYYEHNDFFVFSSSIFWVRSMLKNLGVTIKIHRPAAYMLLSLGYLLEDNTLIEGVKKLTAGKVLKVNTEKIEIQSYFNFYQVVGSPKLTEDLLENLDHKFKLSLSDTYSYDSMFGKNHLSTLSGGLDSRLTVMLAHKLGYTNITTLTFSQGKTDDELVSRSISKDLNIEHLILLQNGGDYLLDVETPLILNNCSVYYFGAAQTYNLAKKLNFENYGLAHHGGLAESSKGGYLSYDYHTKPQLDKRYAVSNYLFPKISQDLLSSIYNLYETDEMFVTYNRGFNAIHNGNWMMQPFANTAHPYMNHEFALLAYSIHPKERFDAQLTIKWINKLHPDLAKYPWRYGILPTTSTKKMFMAKVYNKVVRQFTRANNTYIPFTYWYNTNVKINKLINDTQKDIDDIADILPGSLISDLNGLYNIGSTTEKLLCLSFARSIKLLFLNEL